jgi:hypothetical protein
MMRRPASTDNGRPKVALDFLAPGKQYLATICAQAAVAAGAITIARRQP